MNEQLGTRLAAVSNHTRQPQLANRIGADPHPAFGLAFLLVLIQIALAQQGPQFVNLHLGQLQVVKQVAGNGLHMFGGLP